MSTEEYRTLGYFMFALGLLTVLAYVLVGGRRKKR